MTLAMAITSEKIVHHTSLQVYDEKKGFKPTLQFHPNYNVQTVLIFWMKILQLVLLNPN